MKITHDELLDAAADVMNAALIELETKGADYAPLDDALNEFTTTADRMGLRPEQVWGVHFGKQSAAVMRFCRDGVLDSETLESRITDIIAYAAILYAMTTTTKEAL